MTINIPVETYKRMIDELDFMYDAITRLLESTKDLHCYPVALKRMEEVEELLRLLGREKKKINNTIN